MWDHTSNSNIKMYINKFRLRVELARNTPEKASLFSLKIFTFSTLYANIGTKKMCYI